MTFHLAQINIASPVAPLDAATMAGFVAGLPRMNALAERSPGFVWRLTGEDGDDATTLRVFEDVMVNMSVWESIAALKTYAYKSEHVRYVRRRHDWFDPPTSPHMALWWIPAGTIPTLEDGEQRIEHLRNHGETPHAFTFKRSFAPPAPTP
jgi:hypothetical protein